MNIFNKWSNSNRCWNAIDAINALPRDRLKRLQLVGGFTMQLLISWRITAGLYSKAQSSGLLFIVLKDYQGFLAGSLMNLIIFQLVIQNM